MHASKASHETYSSTKPFVTELLEITYSHCEGTDTGLWTTSSAMRPSNSDLQTGPEDVETDTITSLLSCPPFHSSLSRPSFYQSNQQKHADQKQPTHSIPFHCISFHSSLLPTSLPTDLHTYLPKERRYHPTSFLAN